MSLPIVTNENPQPRDTRSDAEIQAELEAFERSERERLGILSKRRQWADSMTSPVMTAKERAATTLLIGGLTAAQDFLIEGALKGQGYNVEHMRVPDQLALQTGKEFGNRGQCNPTYFTVGNLVSHLQQQVKEKGFTAEDVIKKNVFLTAGACGPCRFGMYVTEYRKALRDAGFDGFRVMLFQQQGGLSQATGDDPGIDMRPPFFIAIVKAIVAGDVLNAIGYRIRPYEKRAGATNEALEEAKRIVYGALMEKKSVLRALWRAKKVLAAVEVDRLRPRPKVSIIGEFWAMTTEGDGNYFLQKFLESEGSENDIQLTTAWLLYNIWEVTRDTLVRRDLRGADDAKKGLKKLGVFGVAKRLLLLKVAELVLRRVFAVFAWCAGLYGYKLPNMWRVAELSHDYYNHDLRGGEGHMEVGKLIMNVVDAKAHMTVSVKPFGCMPSSGVSDGVQSLVQARHPGTIFCAVETSGDGAANFYSRVQMFMFKARAAAEAELAASMKDAGVTEAQVREYLARNPKMGGALHHPPHRHGVAGTAANLVWEIAPAIKHGVVVRFWLGSKAATVARARQIGRIAVGVGRVGVALFKAETWSKVWNDVVSVKENLAR